MMHVLVKKNPDYNIDRDIFRQSNQLITEQQTKAKNKPIYFFLNHYTTYNEFLIKVVFADDTPRKSMIPIIMFIINDKNKNNDQQEA